MKICLSIVIFVNPYKVPDKTQREIATIRHSPVMAWPLVLALWRLRCPANQDWWLNQPSPRDLTSRPDRLQVSYWLRRVTECKSPNGGEQRSASHPMAASDRVQVTQWRPASTGADWLSAFDVIDDQGPWQQIVWDRSAAAAAAVPSTRCFAMAKNPVPLKKCKAWSPPAPPGCVSP